ncbi:MAG: hypothetical protein WC124_10715 [Desulfoplanes sp.]
MGFFSEEQKKTAATGKFGLGGGALIPDNTDALAAIDEIGWKEYDGQRYINARWSIMAPDEIKGRKVFQKIRVLEPDSVKSDKARRMLAAIDGNAGGHLMQSNEEPTDMALMQYLANKPMVIKIMVWEIEGKSGNWISAVSPRKQKPLEPAPQPAQQPTMQEMDDCPF